MSEQPNEKPSQSTEDTTPILSYGRNSPQTPPTSAGRVGLFIGGVFSGIFISGFVYFTCLRGFGATGLLLTAPIVLAGKIYWAMQLKQTPRWRGFGSGLITSSGLIVLLVGACFGILATMKF